MMISAPRLAGTLSVRSLLSAIRIIGSVSYSVPIIHAYCITQLLSELSSLKSQSLFKLTAEVSGHIFSYDS